MIGILIRSGNPDPFTEKACHHIVPKSQVEKIVVYSVVQDRIAFRESKVEEYINVEIYDVNNNELCQIPRNDHAAHGALLHGATS